MRGTDFAARGPIVDTLAEKSINAIDSDATPRDTRGKNEGSCPNDVITIEKHFARLRIDAGDGACDQNFRPQPLRLPQGATGKFVSRDSAGKSKIVLNPRRRPGLSA